MDLLRSLRRFADFVLDELFPPRNGEKVVRATREEDVLALRAIARTQVGTFEVVSLARFRTPLMRALVHEAKYRANTRAQRLLGVLLAEGLRGEHGVLVPIPLSKTRLRERGFNQCDVIAKEALARLSSGTEGLSLNSSLLTRIRDTEHQTALTRAGRRANVAGAFGVPDSRQPLPAHTYILFDDVLTTGATLEAAAAALRDAGATDIRAITLAY